MISLDKYINLKYKHRGREFNGVDCYGLVWLVLKNEKQIILPEYEYEQRWYLKGRNYILEIKKDLTNWSDINIEGIKPFDIILFYNTPNKMIVNHMGIYIGEEKFLHIGEEFNSLVDRLNNYWKNRIYAIVRYTKEVQPVG